MRAARAAPPPIRFATSPSNEPAPADRLGQGVSSEVLRAELTEPRAGQPVGTPVALKRSRNAEGYAALDLEIEILTHVHHPALLPVWDHGVDGDTRWAIVPLLAGQDLQGHFADGGLSETRLRALGIRVAGALGALHAKGWVHGDVKPSNIRCNAEGEAFLLDLGFAARIGSPFQERGTPGYLPPEAHERPNTSPAADAFALGVCLYAAATGEHPVPSALPLGEQSPVLASFSRRDARRPSRRAGSLSPAFDQWLALSLDPDPQRRPSARDSVRELQMRPPWPMDPTVFPEQENPWSQALRMPFAGREPELARFAGFAREALQASRPTLVIVSAKLGGGRSRLLSEAARRARRLRHFPTLLTGRLSSFQEERPGHVLRGMVRQWLALPPHAAPRAQDAEELGRFMPPGEARAVLMALGDPQSDDPTVAESQALVDFFVRLAQRGPLWIQLDDADFGGRASLEPLERLAKAGAGLPILLALGVGPEPLEKSQRALAALEADWKLHGQVQRFDLGPLSRTGVMELVRVLFVPRDASRELAAVLHQRTEGDPSRLRELLRTLEARGQMAPEGTRWSLSIEPEAIPMPPSQVQALSARYQRLEPEARQWLVRCAVSGGHLSPELLARAFGGTPQQVERHIAEFVRAEWLERSAAGARFRRPQVRRALVRAIPPERRRRLHESLAQALRRKPNEPFVIGPAFERAWHLQAAGNRAELLQLLPRLIRSVQRGGHPSRLLLLARWGAQALEALDLPAERRARQLAVYLILGAKAAHELGKRDSEAQFLNQLLALGLDPLEDALQLGMVQMQMGRFAAATSDAAKAIEYFQSARRSFQRAEALEFEAEATLDYGKLCAALGDLKEAYWAVETTARMPLRSPERSRVWTLRGNLALLEDRLEEALRHLNQAKRLLAGDSRRRAQARSAEAELLRSRTYRLLGRNLRAWASLRLADRLARRSGERTLQVDVLIRRGRLLTEFGREQEAELDLREGLRLAEAIDDRRSRARATVLLGILLAEQEDAEALRVLQRALRLAQEYKLPRMEALASTLVARMDLRVGRLDRAQALSERALYLMEEAGAELQDRLVALCTAHLLQVARGHGDARRTLERAHREWRNAHDRIESPLLRQRHRRAYQALLRGALSLEGPLYPRSSPKELPGMP